MLNEGPSPQQALAHFFAHVLSPLLLYRRQPADPALVALSVSLCATVQAWCWLVHNAEQRPN